MKNWKAFGGIVAAVSVMLCLSSWTPADAQPTPSTAKVTRATGRVEVLRKGQSQWLPISVGGQLVQDDQIRALGSSSADLSLPDGSTVVVAENSRFAVTKMDYDAKTRERFIAFHVIVGKLKAEVVRAAVQVARTRQSNFLISGPSGVAAVRGTVIVYIVNTITGQTLVTVFPSPGQNPATATATFVPIGAPPGTAPITLTAGQFTTLSPTQAPAPASNVTSLPSDTQAALQTIANSATASADALTTITITTIVNPTQFVQADTQTTTTTVVDTPTIGSASPCGGC